MRKFNQVELVLFDSTIAQFKLSISASFTKKREDNTHRNLVYTNTYTPKNGGEPITTLKANPSIYLVFGYRGETYAESEGLYTSYPQLFTIREAMTSIKDLLVTGECYQEIENVLAVRPEYQEPLQIVGIGRDSKSISFGIAAVDETDGQGNIVKKVPGVTIHISDSVYASVLTAEEFLTIYTIIMDLDLTNIQVQLMSLFFSTMTDDYQAPAPAPANNYQQRQSQYQQPQTSGASYPQPQASRARYGATTARSSFKPRTAPVTRNQPVYQEAEVTPQSYMETPDNTERPSNTRGNLPPRNSEKNIVNMKNVEETPVSNVNFNNEDAINDIFKDEE